MAFIKRLWKDRISEFPNRRTINDGNVTKQVTVGRDEGNITEEGDSFDASNMNDLEQRIEDAYGDLQGLVASEVAQQYDSANVIFDAEPTEGHGTGYTVTSEGIKTAIDSGLVHTKTESGSLVHITDGADNIPVKSLVSQIVAVESGNGEKSPENPYIISGFDSGIIKRSGINLFDGILEKGYISTTTGEDITNTSGNQWRCKNYICVKPNTSLYMKLLNGYTTNNSNITVYYYDVNKNFIGYESNKGNTVIQTPSNCHWFRFCNYIVTAIQDAPTGNSINYPSSDTQYHAYNGNTYTFAFGQTVYGGYFDNKGNLVVTHKAWITNGTETWIDDGNGNYYTASHYSFDSLSGSNDGKSNYFTYKWSFGQINGCMAYTNRINLSNTSFASVEDLQTAFNQKPLVIVYPLANPIVLSITSQDIPTLLGENNIFSNCGDLEVTYYVDTDAIYAIRDVIDEFAMQSDWNEADSTKADYIKNKPTIPANADFSLLGLSDTDISSPSAGQALVFDGDNWVNSDVEDNYLPNYWSLFADQNTSNTIKTLNVVSGRKISDFSVLFAVVIRESGERVSTIIPVGRFTNGIWVSLTEVDSVNTQRWYEVKYVDDEHITVQCSTNATGSEVYIYGLGTAATYS